MNLRVLIASRLTPHEKAQLRRDGFNVGPWPTATCTRCGLVYRLKKNGRLAHHDPCRFDAVPRRP